MSLDLQCATLPGNLQGYCQVAQRRFTSVEDDLDEVQKQIYIISGVLGGIALILIIALIAVAIQLSSLRQQALYLSRNSNNPKSKPTPERSGPLTNGNDGESTHLRQPPPHSYAQTPKSLTTAEEELAQMGFSAYTGHHTDPRGLSTSPGMNTSGGVRVLPRNPPTGFRNAGYNEGYM